MELKMVQDMYSIYQNHFLLLFLDISKAYDMLDRGRFLQTLERYGARKKLCGILVDFWENQYVVTRHSRSYVPPFRLTHSTTWVGLASPTLFNVDLGSMLRHWIFLTVKYGALVHDVLGYAVGQNSGML